jgi:molybdopterin-binding protein
LRLRSPPDRCETEAPDLGANYKGEAMKLSARNQLKGRVTGIRRGEAIANVVIEVAGQRLVASITVEAIDELGLTEGTEVIAVIKASDVMVATSD